MLYQPHMSCINVLQAPVTVKVSVMVVVVSDSLPRDRNSRHLLETNERVLTFGEYYIYVYVSK